jgi:formamidopyrimidine-DNA glycosylase
MPELPEVETITRALRKFIVGQKLAGVKVCRADMIKEGRSLIRRTRGDKITAVSRRGKYVIIELCSGKRLLFHLGMTGRLIYSKPQTLLENHTHLRLALGTGELRFSCQRRFGNVRIFGTDKKTEGFFSKRLGPDALEVSLSHFKSLVSGSKQRIKSLLLEQRKIAGLGNIYSDEALFRAGVHPQRPAASLSQEEIKALHRAIRNTLRNAIRHFGSSVSNYMRPDGSVGEFQYYHQVYRREEKPCGKCGARIRRIKFGGRSTYFCPNCQR